mmetsp:Transcript_18874/g.26574  ORF Transcript_18874/g.26574 Transcript_18874/m.26574 type:complete len:555 (-) Transcript_18874:25-1689(-)
MAERHTLSEPRPLKSTSTNGSSVSPGDNTLKWEVDVYRKGVSDPIETLVLSDESLPPRKNKRGKVVWRLPTDSGRTPSFGTDEKRRILDLYKEQRKIRRKKSLSSKTSTESFDEGNRAPDSDDTQTANGSPSSVDKRSNGNNKPVISNNDKESIHRNQVPNHSDNLESIISSDIQKLQINAGPQQVRNNGSIHSKGNKDDENSNSAKKIEGSSALSFNDGCNAIQKKKLRNENKSLVEQNKQLESGTGMDNDNKTKAIVPPPGLHMAEAVGQSPPPGFHSSLTSIHHNESSHEKGMSSMDENLPKTNINEISSSLQHERLLNTPSNSPLKQSLPRRFITISESDRPKNYIHPPSLSSLSSYPQPGLHQQEGRTSLAVAAAKAFIDLYYTHVTHGLSTELATYYTPHAQKSISVGGAHSVVSGLSDITVQIASLASTIFVVRGVVAQDSYDLKGAHVLVTGMVQTNALGEGNGITSFAHSISLAPASNISHKCRGVDNYDNFDDDKTDNFSFQIHNDALSLMTGDNCLSDHYQIYQRGDVGLELRNDHRSTAFFR